MSIPYHDESLVWTERHRQALSAPQDSPTDTPCVDGCGQDAATIERLRERLAKGSGGHHGPLVPRDVQTPANPEHMPHPIRRDT